MSRIPAPSNSSGPDNPDNGAKHLLSARSALIILLSLLTASGAGVLFWLAHRSSVLTTIGALGVLAGALKFYDWLIDLDNKALVSLARVLSHGRLGERVR
jgi:hypothetical protein